LLFRRYRSTALFPMAAKHWNKQDSSAPLSENPVYSIK
jgi:hypothetical protein